MPKDMMPPLSGFIFSIWAALLQLINIFIIFQMDKVKADIWTIKTEMELNENSSLIADELNCINITLYYVQKGAVIVFKSKA
jgi:hypothetical protein